MQQNKNLRVLVLTSTFPRWEGDTIPPFVMDLCKRLVEHDIKIDVLAPHTTGAKKNEKLHCVNVFRYKYFFEKWEKLAYGGGILGNVKENKLLYITIPFFIFFQIKNILYLVKKNKYDLVHAHWLIPQGLVSVFISKFIYKNFPKILCTSHGGDLFAFQSSFSTNIKKWILNHSDAVTVVSEHMKNVCLSLIGEKDKIYICSMGVDLTQKFVPLKKVSRDERKIIFVGRLVEKKGVSILLEAIHQAIKEIPDLKLLVIGDGPEREKLELLSNDLGLNNTVTFLGALKQDQLPEMYSSASIAIMPSVIDSRNDQEGLGLVAIEAMGCECAVIASSLPAISDIIKNNKNGLLVKPGDSNELAGSIVKLIDDKNMQESIASSGRQSVVEKFDWNIVANNYKKIINTLV